MSEIVSDIHLNIPHSPLLSFYTNSSHQTRISALIVNNIPHANLKRCSRFTEASHDFVPPPHFHRAKNVFHATTNFTFFTIVFFLLVGQRRISITFFHFERKNKTKEKISSEIVCGLVGYCYDYDVGRIAARNHLSILEHIEVFGFEVQEEYNDSFFKSLDELREIAREFGVSHSTVKRKTKAKEKRDRDEYRQFSEKKVDAPYSSRQAEKENRTSLRV